MAMFRNIITPSLNGPMIINRYDAPIGETISREGGWDLKDIALLQFVVSKRNNTENRMVILDIGANVGSYSLAFAKWPFPNIEVHSFEAQRLVFMMLAGTMAINSLDNVFVYNKAVSNTSGRTIEFDAANYNVPANFGGMDFNNQQEKDGLSNIISLPRKEIVKTIHIDALNLVDVSLIKIDVEGMEALVLDGARETIEHSRPVLWVEVCRADVKIIEDFLLARDYIFYTATQYDIIALPKEMGLVFNV